jgi:hypothetical protein
VKKPKKWTTMSELEQADYIQKQKLLHKERNKKYIEKKRREDIEAIRKKKRELARARRLKNPNGVREYARQRYAKNKDKIIQQQKEQKKKSPEKYRAIAHRSYTKNKDARLGKGKEYFQKRMTENPEAIRSIKKRWALKNPNYHKGKIEKVSDYYVAVLLHTPVKQLRNHPDLIAVKREQIKILRELKPTTRKKKQNAQESK